MAVIAPVPQVRRATSNEPRSLYAEHGAVARQASGWRPAPRAERRGGADGWSGWLGACRRPAAGSSGQGSHGDHRHRPGQPAEAFAGRFSPLWGEADGRVACLPGTST